MNFFTPATQLMLKRAFLTIRPKTLPASIAPVVVSQTLAYFHPQFDGVLALCIFLCALFLQISVNLANDVSDFAKGVDNQNRLGPKRASLEGWFSHKQMRIALGLSLLLSLMFGVYLVLSAPNIYLLLGALALLSVLAYSSGPYPLASHGLGEAFVFIFFGLVAVIGGFCLHGIKAMPIVYVCAIQMGCLTSAIMLVNNIRDRHSDEDAKKRTLVVLLGVDYARKLYIVLLLLPFVLLVWLPELLLAWLGLPMGLYLIFCIYKRDAKALNKQLSQTAALCLVFALLVCLSLLLIPQGLT